jgi:tetratricopeptide (TPR) repeat protein
LAGALDRLGQSGAAERVLSTAVRLVPDNRRWWFRLGRVRERRRDWRGAESAYRRAVGEDPGAVGDTDAGQSAAPAAWWYQLGRVRQRRKDWRGAQSAYTAAIGLGSEVAHCHGYRAQVSEQLGHWSAAVEGYQRALSIQPEQARWLAGLAHALTNDRRPVEAVDVCTRALVQAPSDHRLRRALATAHEALGQWRAAADILRQEVARWPDDHRLRYQLVQCLEQLGNVPFGLDRDGRHSTGPDHKVRSAALDEAVEQLEHLAAHAPARVRDLFHLGLLHERRSALAEAASAYRRALTRLQTADAWWGHQSAEAWAFRLAYVEQRLGHRPEQADVRLHRGAIPVAISSRGLDRAAGFFEALITDQGLRLSGFQAPTLGSGLDIHLDGQPLRHIATDTRQWRPTFLYDITDEVLRELPVSSEITVEAGGARLATIGGGTAVKLTIPDGTGKLATLLADGRSLTKKGSWSLSGAGLADRQRRYLEVYQLAKKELEERLGRHLFLCYGSLLGCCREGDFIPGDDDFDASYVSTAPDPEAFRQECLQVALELLRGGLDLNLSINGRPFKVGLDGVWVDATPMWLYRGRAWSFNAHDLSADAFEPVRQGRFRGLDVYLPQDTESLLADTYGPGWRTPQPDFRYYRTRDDNRTLARMWLTPSEVGRLRALVADERSRNPSAGRFAGIGLPSVTSTE